MRAGRCGASWYGGGAVTALIAPLCAKPHGARRVIARLRPEACCSRRPATWRRSTKEISRHLNLSPRTVESYRLNLMRKVSTKNLADLVRLAIAAVRQRT
ncbi:LuxR C-terminal-related transcriptional regulator [Bradyrhizobium sp. CCBAU 45384]|uniref:LuxR C-terminal-related transcriptional regulator n=1 Tax=Bradyrhizobium sp. CCBAU 45384 TaxID=858428 RepID=UPI002306D714|nr:LuxR C-terminal-related transcriptional regulator [Bradyrhizobium sp. CCBAU 45384]